MRKFLLTLAFLIFTTTCFASRAIMNEYNDGGVWVEYYIFELDDGTAGEYKFYKGKDDQWAYYKPEFMDWHKVKTQEEMDLYWKIKKVYENH